MSMRPDFAAITILAGWLLCATVVGAEPESPPRKLTFAEDILPIFRAKCLRCHAGTEPKGGLNLSQPSALLTGGKSGAAIRIAAAEFSLLYEKIAADEMPAAGPKLSAAEKGVIRTWINDGARGVQHPGADGEAASADDGASEFWSFQPPQRPALPQPLDPRRVRNPIDAFVLERLEAKQLGLAPEADRLTLLRRASFDLHGLPPSPAEVRRFLADQRPDAYQRMLERLLASPRYGERWARHWLDVAGYADSAGILNEDRPLPLLWRYRDYVIRAFNDDKPYDRFLQEQIAGDELTGYWAAYETAERLPDEVVEGLTATGFLRTAADPSRPDFSTIKNAAAQYFYPTLFDTLQIVASSTMGLTLQCARCHGHKFDPIPQADYYRLQAVFTSAYRPDAWIPQMNRRLNVASKQQEQFAQQRNAEVDEQVKGIESEIDALRKQFAERLFAARLAEVDEGLRGDVQAAFAAAEADRSDTQKALVAKFQTQLRPAGKELEEALGAAFPEYPPQVAERKLDLAAAQRRRVVFDEVRALYDVPGAAETPLLLRGDPLTPGPLVQPGVISALDTPQPFQWSPPPPEARSSGRRLAFARWLTQPQHPLTARVMVNRIWMHHFGRGIVATPEDFGVSGAPPSHPELLDWLATELVRSGWRVKHIHRLILTSSTWRQRSRVPAEQRRAGEQVDPDNRLLWRQSLRRLEAEPLRDALLAVSGSLDNALHGAPAAVRRLGNGEVVVSDGPGQRRRSIYLQILRLNPQTMLEVFDQPEISINCTQRRVSTVSTQALALLNSDLMVRAAESFADRVLAQHGDDAVGEAVLAAFSRPATDEERELLSEFLAAQTELHRAALGDAAKQQPQTLAGARRQALADLCHMLLSANEFAYVD